MEGIGQYISRSLNHYFSQHSFHNGDSQRPGWADRIVMGGKVLKQFVVAVAVAGLDDKRMKTNKSKGSGREATQGF